MVNAHFTPVVNTGTVLSSQQLEQFNEDGCLIIPSLLDADEIARIHSLHQRAEELAYKHGESFARDQAHYDVEKLSVAGIYALRKVTRSI